MKSQKPVCKISSDGSKAWYLNGYLHRTDGPAYEGPDGSKYWYLHEKLHRTDGPAVEYSDGSKRWYLNGNLHRTDGPAVVGAGASNPYWYLNGTDRNHPPKSYKDPLNLGDLVIIDGSVNFVCKRENLACLLNPSNQWIFEWEKRKSNK